MVGSKVLATRVYPDPQDNMLFVLKELPEKGKPWTVAGHDQGKVEKMSFWEDLKRIYLHLDNGEMWRLEISK